MAIINGRNVNLFDSMFDYVNDANFSHYKISDGKEREVPFIEAIKPIEDSDFMITPEDIITYDGRAYESVNFGEDDSEAESFLLSSAIGEEVFLIYIEQEPGIPVYVPATGQAFRTEELAKLSGYYEV